jgi:hypothetical protein
VGQTLLSATVGVGVDGVFRSRVQIKIKGGGQVVRPTLSLGFQLGQLLLYVRCVEVVGIDLKYALQLLLRQA